MSARAWSLRGAMLLAIVALLGACGEAHVVRREPGSDLAQRAQPSPRHAGAKEVDVVRGDTLYGIAFRNGMDFRDLAEINGIDAPYTIYVGQVLRLRPRAHGDVPPRPVAASPHPAGTKPGSLPPPRQPAPVQPAASAGHVPAATAHAPAPTPFETVPPPTETTLPATHAAPPPTTAASPQTATGMAGATPVVTPAPGAVHPAVLAPTAATVPRPDPVAVAPPLVAVARTPSAALLPAVVAPPGGVGWHWPAKGTLLDRFAAGDATRQGIDIGGNAGDPVLAAGNGVVVYSGSGLVGYGELVIIKHSDEWLSAYGHNRKRLVQEGQRVKSGQPIAEMGSTGAPRDELHFEIRRNGRPVDPQQYLPAR